MAHYKPPRIPFRFTPLPKIIVEQWLPFLKEAEFRVYVYVAHRTWGHHHKHDGIPLSQIAHGQQTSTGKVRDHGAGLSMSTARRAVHSLVKKGLLSVVERLGRASLYTPLTIWKQLDDPYHSSDRGLWRNPYQSSDTPPHNIPARAKKKRKRVNVVPIREQRKDGTTS